MKLLGWHEELRPEIVAAIKSGQIKVITVQDKKLGNYQLLQGEVAIGNTVVCFK
jgi:hypothetical protein